ncbi:MAG: hypothetical protein ABI579_03495 [Candidatus Sumerlaeota bacterium]
MTPQSFKALFLMLVLVVSTIGQSVDFARSCTSATPGASLVADGQDPNACEGTPVSRCVMNCPKGHCCCGHETPVVPGSLAFTNPTCGDNTLVAGGIIFPQIFGWKFVPGNQQATDWTSSHLSRLPQGEVKDFAADFRSPPATPPPRAA